MATVAQAPGPDRADDADAGWFEVEVVAPELDIHRVRAPFTVSASRRGAIVWSPVARFASTCVGRVAAPLLVPPPS